MASETVVTCDYCHQRIRHEDDLAKYNGTLVSGRFFVTIGTNGQGIPDLHRDCSRAILAEATIPERHPYKAMEP